MNQMGPNTSTNVQFNAQGWVARVLGLVILVTLIVIGFLIALPLIAIILVLGLILYIYIRIRMFFAKAHNPNGPLDGRRNVRVVDRDE